MDNVNTTPNRNIPKTNEPNGCILNEPILIISAYLIFLCLALILAIIFTNSKTVNESETTDSFEIYLLLREAYTSVSNINKFPYFGALISRNPNVFLCPVIIITSRSLLTGATCFITSFHGLYVRVGSNFWDKYGAIYEVDSVIINDKFTSQFLENNLALVKLKKDIVFKENVQPAKIGIKSSENENGVVVGWISKFSSTCCCEAELVERNISIWNDEKCLKYYNNPNLICGTVLQTNYTRFDTTGALIQNGKLIGFWSWGRKFSNVNPVFSNLSRYIKWINDTVN